MTSVLFTTLKTTRLKLRRLKTGDALEIMNIRSDEEVNQYIDRPKSVTETEALQFIKKVNKGIKKNEWYYWAITMKGNNTVIGTICLWKIIKETGMAETGYELHPDHHQQGIMYEALSRVMEFAKSDLQLRTIEAFIDPLNTASAKLLEKCNFKIDREEISSTENKKKLIVYVLTAKDN